MREHLQGEDVFLANYSDGLSDLPLDKLIADFERKKVTASFAAVRSWQTFHTVHSGEDGYVTAIGSVDNGDFLINGGFFVLQGLDLRHDRGGRGTRRAAVPAADLEAATGRLSLSRILALDGHIQGQDHARSHGGARRLSVDAVEQASEPVRPIATC